ncbi:MAG TPA: STAS domain-containing protein [Terriglobales bacterium]|nr:STAS domain-containing protein [Terriglobales bacterium]
MVPMIAVWMKIESDRIADSLREAREKLDTADGEVVLDFSSVRRIDAPAIKALQEFAAAAEEKSVKVALRAVNADVYKVLKLVRLAARFSFVV